MKYSTTKELNEIDSCLEEMKNQGFIKRFLVKPEGVQDQESGKYYTSNKVKIINFFFFSGEGVTNNSVIVYGIETNDHQRGTIVSTKIIQ